MRVEAIPTLPEVYAFRGTLAFTAIVQHVHFLDSYRIAQSGSLSLIVAAES